MVLDFLFKKKKQEQTAQEPAKEQQTEVKPAATPAAPAVTEAEKQPKDASKKETIEERIDREMQSLPAFIKNKVSDPAVKQKFIELAKRMEKDGIDMNSPRAMKKWVKEHEKELKQEQQGVNKVTTVVKPHQPGRNDLCPCGSGKKYKKCCGRNA